MKDYYQKWMEEQAQSLIDKTSTCGSCSDVGEWAHSSLPGLCCFSQKQLILNDKQELSDVLNETSGRSLVSQGYRNALILIIEVRAIGYWLDWEVGQRGMNCLVGLY